MSTIRLIIGIAILIALVFLGLYFAQNGAIPYLGFGDNSGSSAQNLPPTTDVSLSALAMLIGLFFGALHQQLSGKNEQVKMASELKVAVTSAAFFRSLLVAPLVFGGVYAISGSQPDLVVALIFAFQNGFFCEAIFREKHVKQ